MWDKDFLKSDLEGQSVEITQTENHRGKRLRKKINRISEICTTISSIAAHV